jgi:tripartite motif-containing protein 71
MWRFGRLYAGRTRWLVAFALFLFATSAAPVLADPLVDAPPTTILNPVPPEPELATSEAEQALLPDGQDIREGIEATEQAEAARQQWLRTPEAIQEREESRDAFAALTASAAQELLLSTFAEQLEMLNSDPARFLSDAKILAQPAESVATVSDDGDTSLLDAGIPVRAADEEGELRKVDLSLLETSDGFEPANPLTDVSIPFSAGEPVEVGKEGLAVIPVGVNGDREAQRLGDENVFYYEVLPGTDRLIAPTAMGVEIFDILRSEDSPEAFRFQLDLPIGAELRSDGNGGAEVIRDGSVLTHIPFPTALDAQGTDVPVDLVIDGSSIVLQVAHRNATFAYPVLVDPSFDDLHEDWYNCNWYSNCPAAMSSLTNGTWQWTSQPYGLIYIGTGCFYTCWGSGRGLYITAPSRNYGANVYSHWSYSAPNQDSYLANAWINYFWRDNHGCSKSSYPQPHDYDGMWDRTSWVRFDTNLANDQGWADAQSWGRAFIIGVSSGGGINIPCWRDVMAGGVAVWLDDWQYPTVDSVSGIPDGWVSDTERFTIAVRSRDEGLGVRYVKISQGGGEIRDPPQSDCTGLAASRCPTTRDSQFVLDGDSFLEGQRITMLSALDPTQKASSTYQWQMKVDTTPPRVDVGGSLAVATREDRGDGEDPELWDELTLPVYNLDIRAEDGSNDRPELMRSGVRSIEAFIDSSRVPDASWQNPSCPESSCPLDETYQLQLHDLSAGRHTLRVLATDFVGQASERRIEFEYIPATGIKDEYVMQYFPLSEDEEDSSAPELAVNIMNGNLVYHEQDVDVTGPAVDLEIERYYNSMLPPDQNTEWGDGWTLAQTPELEPEEGQGPPEEADLIDTSGALEDSVALPTEAGREQFDPELQATVVKEASGGYELIDESGDTATSIAFDPTGQAEALRTDGYAKVDYDYESGDLSEIVVSDPASVTDPSASVRAPVYASAFGDPGYRPEQIAFVYGVAVSQGGDILVADYDNGAVKVFSPDGRYLDQLELPGAYPYYSPIAVAVDPTGGIWVADTSESRILKFDASGAYLGQFGSAGQGDGEFNWPSAIAFDAEGDVLVADYGNSRVQKFSPDGRYLDQFGANGTGDGELSGPSGVAVDARGDIWVADTGNSRVQRFSPTGDYIEQFGSYGSGDGQFDYVATMAIGPQGTLWVVDAFNHRVQIFDSDGDYLDQFGSHGSGPGQFDAAYGIAFDAEQSRVFITDVYNDRVQRWDLPSEVSEDVIVHSNSFGANGSGEGQFNSPQGSAVDSEGNIWVVDRSNYRIQKFSPDGEFLSRFGAYGSGDGQLYLPSDIAIDADGNIWVVDRGNHRIQKFDSQGRFLMRFGTSGTGEGQFLLPTAMAFDSQGNIFVTEGSIFSRRVQKFNPRGEFLARIGSPGTGDGQFSMITGIAIDSADNLYVADTGNDRVQTFDSQGRYLAKFGTTGTGEGQFNSPSGIAIGPQGRLFVTDTTNNNVQVFSSDGRYLERFGTTGSGEGQLSGPYDVSIDAGRVLVADTVNHRVQEWWSYEQRTPPLPSAEPDDPMLEVETAAGLVSEVEGEEAGEHFYEHQGNLLTSHEGPEGETQYRYANADMTGIELPDGTTASIAYHTTSDRVMSVTVDLAGVSSARTTYFDYRDVPRQTTVTPPDAPVTVYDIGDDGSIFKWWNVKQPPDFYNLSGTLYANKETANPIATGTHLLHVEAHSEEGIASIQILEGGPNLVSEKTCEQDPETPGIECKYLTDEWVAETGSFPPGIIYIEVMITDHRRQTESERFWVNIPYTPPPTPGVPEPPRFKDILAFREEFGLDLDLRGDETAINSRIFNLIGDWHNPQTPAGEIARATMERWGMPLRAVDAAELDYREAYVAQAATAIPGWAEVHAPSTFGGYYVDHRQGGKLYVGFTSNQAATVSALKASGALMAPDRVLAFPTPPANPQGSLWSILASLPEKLESDPSVRAYMSKAEVDVASNRVRIEATQTAPVNNFISSQYGASAPVSIVYTAHKPQLRIRYRADATDGGKLLAGDSIGGDKPWCTLGFGASESRGAKPNGQPVVLPFALTAGHCFLKEANAYVFSSSSNKANFGRVTRRVVEPINGFWLDGEAILREDGFQIPRWIYWSSTTQMRVTGSKTPVPGSILCVSGSWYERSNCGVASQPFLAFPDDSTSWVVQTSAISTQGDSGGPVWNVYSGHAVGLIQGGYEVTGPTWFTPLRGITLPTGESPPPTVPGLLKRLDASGGGDFNIAH